MSQRVHRRDFLRGAATGGTMLGLGELSFLSGLPPVSAAEARLAPGTVPLQPDMEPLVRLLEDTPRERLLEVVGARVRKGLSYQQTSRRLASGRGAEHPAATLGRIQVPCRSGGQFGLPGQSCGCRRGSLVGPLLGARLFQGHRRPATCRKAAGG